MSEIINDSNDEVLAVEETVETPAETIQEAVVEAPEVAAAPVEDVIVEPAKTKKAKSSVSDETVVLFTKKDIDWSGVGKLKAGYNTVSKADADRWLSGSLDIHLIAKDTVARLAE